MEVSDLVLKCEYELELATFGSLCDGDQFIFDSDKLQTHNRVRVTSYPGVYIKLSATKYISTSRCGGEQRMQKSDPVYKLTLITAEVSNT